MFKKRIYSLMVLWCLLAGGIAWFFHDSPSRSQRVYQRLMDYSDSSRNNSSKVFKAEQRRTNVSKQILFLQTNERLQWRLNSDSSELSFDQNEDSLELIERFKGITCIMQEKLVADKQTQFVRSLTAKDAIYHYKNEKLIADEAVIARYEIPGLSWISSLTDFLPFMTGKAEQIELSFKHKPQPSFKAQKFQATFNHLEQGL
jgi:hypothetical protein